MWLTFKNLTHNYLMNVHSSIIVDKSFLFKTARHLTGSNHCIKTWQSCDFKSRILLSFRATFLVILEAKPSANFTNLMNLQNFRRFTSIRVYFAVDFINLLPSSYKCYFCLIPKLFKSYLALSVSLDLWGSANSVPSKLSHTFFSTYITLRLYFNSMLA